MWPMIFSILGLWVAPLLHRFAQRYARTHWWLEKALLLVLAVLVMAHLLPHSLELAGGWALAMAGLGLVLPSAVERAWHHAAHRVHQIPLIVGMAGLAVHASLDGAALGTTAPHGHMHVLPWAVALHRIPVGLLVWWALYPQTGWKAPAAVLGMVTVFTGVGFAFGGVYLEMLQHQAAYGLFQALVAGSLLHVVFDTHHDP